MMGRGETNSMITVFVPRNKAVEWRSSENRITIRFLRFSVTISIFFLSRIRWLSSNASIAGFT